MDGVRHWYVNRVALQYYVSTADSFASKIEEHSPREKNYLPSSGDIDM